MQIEDFLIEVKLILNNELYESNLITYSQYTKALKEIRKKKVC